MSELYPVLVLKGLGWLLMARITPCSRADVAQLWPRSLRRRASASHTPYLAETPGNPSTAPLARLARRSLFALGLVLPGI